MSALEEYNAVTDQHTSEGFVSADLADAMRDELLAEVFALRATYREVTGKDWNWDTTPRER